MNENTKYEIIKQLVDNNGNKKRAATKLACSIRTINRLIKRYNEEGKEAFRHKNHDNKPAITIEDETKSKIITLYNNKYTGFNFTHFNEYLRNEEKIIISYNALYNLLSSHNIVSSKARRKTKRANILAQNEIKNSKDSISDNMENDLIIEHKEVSIKDCHPRQERAKYAGEVIQLDASLHLWFGDTKTQLHLAIDEASDTLVGGHFYKQETIVGYYNVLHDILGNYGIPYSFKVDCRTIFVYNSLKKRGLEKDTFTQFSFACSLLGIGIKTTSIPQAKGKIERSFNTHQDRLVNELKLMNITTIEGANEYLKNTYINHHNKMYALPIKDSTSVFVKQPSEKQINLILSIRSERVIDSGNAIKYKNKYYQTYENDKLITLKPKIKCIVIEAFDGKLYLEAADKVYHLVELKRNKEVSPDFDLDIVAAGQVSKKVNTPAANHPWRHAMILEHRKNIKNNIKTLEEYYDDCVPLESV